MKPRSMYTHTHTHLYFEVSAVTVASHIKLNAVRHGSDSMRQLLKEFVFKATQPTDTRRKSRPKITKGDDEKRELNHIST